MIFHLTTNIACLLAIYKNKKKKKVKYIEILKHRDTNIYAQTFVSEVDIIINTSFYEETHMTPIINLKLIGKLSVKNSIKNKITNNRRIKNHITRMDLRGTKPTEKEGKTIKSFP